MDLSGARALKRLGVLSQGIGFDMTISPSLAAAGLVKRDGVKRDFLQVEGSLIDRDGIFEFIVDPDQGITHQRFIEGGIITGQPNQKVN